MFSYNKIPESLPKYTYYTSSWGRNDIFSVSQSENVFSVCRLFAALYAVFRITVYKFGEVTSVGSNNTRHNSFQIITPPESWLRLLKKPKIVLVHNSDNKELCFVN